MDRINDFRFEISNFKSVFLFFILSILSIPVNCSWNRAAFKIRRGAQGVGGEGAAGGGV